MSSFLGTLYVESNFQEKYKLKKRQEDSETIKSYNLLTTVFYNQSTVKVEMFALS